jgi:hypothetical protein
VPGEGGRENPSSWLRQLAQQNHQALLIRDCSRRSGERSRLEPWEFAK